VAEHADCDGARTVRGMSEWTACERDQGKAGQAQVQKRP